MTIQELEITAQLARLNPDPKQLAGILPEFEQMVGLLNTMEEADKDDDFAVKMQDGEKLYPVAGTLFAGTDHFRGDGIEKDPDPALNEKLPEALLEACGERDGRFIVIPNVL
ncbi:MAG: aspartyl/glutamyl-tRNA amidotransferase subunit C [Treponema sp.]|jgi:aspartyl-tRNA(Asn)/glutamyl-tRNA(Gln) amidotransferase subunit C|nr:aspartyl/glutamyl-tRNA amidotransferase subunit C [Treponema sp.]